MKSIMSHDFSLIPKVEIPRSVFNRTHGYKTTLNEDYLYPIYCDEALPGDTFSGRMNILCRLQPCKFPVMDNLYIDTFFFAVPYRLIWSNFKKFMGEKEYGDATEYLLPQINTAAFGAWPATPIQPKDLYDYMGLPQGIAGIKFCSLWARAYTICWNTWFRDQNQQTEMPVDLSDGPEPSTAYALLKRCKKHDYFTSCLPEPQKGPGVEISLGAYANVIGNGKSLGMTDGTDHFGLVYDAVDGHTTFVQQAYNVNVGTNVSVGPTPPTSGGLATGADSVNTGLAADLNNISVITINALRQAFQIQKMQERDARGGTRYIEKIRSHFGVISPDARMQRPEYLGGSSQRINVSPIAQTSTTNGEARPLASIGGLGVGFGQSSFVKSFTEHCIIIGLVNIRADITYQQGIPRMFSRRTLYDMYWPSLAHIGEQAVLNKEIYCQGPAVLDPNNNPIDDNAFGYQERFAEYRYFPSQITSEMRSTYATPLDAWHLSEKFTGLPVIGSGFIEMNTPVSRVVNVTNQDHFLLDSVIELHCARPMPVYSVPGLIDHF